MKPKPPAGRRGTRSLIEEPLTADDWAIIHALHVGFCAGVESVVMQARERQEKNHD